MTDRTPPEAPDVHLDEQLSAYLDGELDPIVRQRADEHLAACADCRGRLDALGHVRSLLRDAPRIDPPHGFIERVVRDRRRRRFIPAIAAVSGLAAVWLLVVGMVVAGPPRIEPPVGEIATAHAGFGGRPASRDDFRADEITFEAVDDDDEIPDEFRPPDELAGAEFARGYRATNRPGWLVAYDDERATIVVYEELGEYLVGGLPGGGEQFEVDGSRAWRRQDVDGRNAVVVQRGWMVYTLVGEVEVDRLVELAEQLPERDEPETPSLGDRLDDAVDRFLDGFSLGV
jgi:Putative zinc-finger